MRQLSLDQLDSLTLVVLLAAALVPWAALSQAMTPFRSGGMNLIDAKRMEQGYYQNLLAASRAAGAKPLGRPAPDPPNATLSRVALESGPMMTAVDDAREHTLAPGYSELTRRGLWTNNSWGLRDREYTREKPPHTIRLALLGDSIGAGWGVADGAGFEPRLETALDAWSRAAGGPAVEILNYSVPGHAPGQRWEQFLRLDGWSTAPDLLIYEATPADSGWDERRLRGLLARGIGWDSPQYQRALERAGIHRGLAREAIERRLSVNRWLILESVYRAIASDCRARGIPSVWILIPRVGRPLDHAERHRLTSLAERTGFRYVLDLSDVFDGLDTERIAVSARDYHPNQEGHSLIAASLASVITANPAQVGWPHSGVESGESP
jgi:hypothetical protein